MKQDNGILLQDNSSYMCCLFDEPRTFDWCENNCERYHRCDTVAWAGEELKLREDEV